MCVSVYMIFMMKYYNMYKHFFKRVIDFSIAFVALSILFIPMLVVALWLHFANKGAGAFFFQERPGKDDKIFKIVKFKTMTDERDINGNMLPDEKRLTKVGKFVRSTSIDEFPQFFNVLRGDMSIIGTRPPLISETNLYELHHRARLAIKPGITGMWQVSGRSDITDFEEVVRLDKEYIENWNIGLDIKILFKTVMVVLKKDGSM